MNPRQHYTAKQAALRYVELCGETPGNVRGIDYQKLHIPGSTDPTAFQDAAHDAMDEKRFLDEALGRAQNMVPHREWVAWWLVRVWGYKPRETDFPERTAYRVLRRVDAAVDEALIERDILKGYGERDLLEAGGRCARDVVVWVNEEAFV